MDDKSELNKTLTNRDRLRRRFWSKLYLLMARRDGNRRPLHTRSNVSKSSILTVIANRKF